MQATVGVEVEGDEIEKYICLKSVVITATDSVRKDNSSNEVIHTDF